MSRIDSHVSKVQTRLAAGVFLNYLAVSLLVLAGAALLAVVLNLVFRLYNDYLPRLHPLWLVGIGTGVCIITAAVLAYLHRPSAQYAATQLDQRLGLKDKFATAMFVRSSDDPFARATVLDAERTAGNVTLGRQFPIGIPRRVYTALSIGVTAALLSLVTPFNFFERKPAEEQKKIQAQKIQENQMALANAISTIESSAPKDKPLPDDLRKLVAELNNIKKNSASEDPSKVARRAQQALLEKQEKVNTDAERARRYAEAQTAMLQSMDIPDDAPGPANDIKNGKLNEAVKKLNDTAKNFDQLDQKEKEKAARDMQKTAEQLKKAANDPAAAEKMKKQLQQMGADEKTAQDMQKMIQQAAQGGEQGRKAAEDLQKKANELAQQMSQQQGATPQQQKQIQEKMQQAMQQMQGQANAQQQANQLGQAADQLAQAMQKSAQAQGNGQQSPQQAQQMADAAKGMQDALQNMDDVRRDADQLQQQADALQQAMGDCQGNQPGGDGSEGNGKGQRQSGGDGKYAQGTPKGQGEGSGEPGLGEGGHRPTEAAPFGTKKERSVSQDNDKGRSLAVVLVKDPDPIKTASKMRESRVAETAQKEASEDIESEHANRGAQKAAREYFRTIEQGEKK